MVGLCGLSRGRDARVSLMVAALVFSGAAAGADGPIAPGEAMAHSGHVDGWVRAWEVPQGEDLGLALASVTLRLDGRVIGRGQAVGERALRTAARAAVVRARAHIREGRDLEPTDGEWGAIGSRVLVSVEAASSLSAATEAEVRAMALRVSPGVHTLVARLGERVEIMTPDEQITLGLWGERAARSLVATLTGDGSAVLWSGDEIVERGVRFSTARTAWVAQPGERLGAVFLDRGGRVFDRSVSSPAAMGEMIDGLASWLLAQRWAGSEPYGMSGTRDAVSGKAVPSVAPVYGQGLAALALTRASARSWSGEDERRAWRSAALRVLLDLADVAPGEDAPWDDAVGSAAVIVAVKELERIGAPVPPGLAGLETRCADSVRGAYTPGVGFAEGVPAGARSLVAWALVRLGDDDAPDALASVFADTSLSELATQTPFVGWAAIELAGDGGIAARGALKRLRASLWEYQLTRSDVDAWDRDLVGGIVFTGAADPLPGSATARPVALACTMLGDERFTAGTVGDENVRRELTRCADSVRFVRQLMLGESGSFLCADPGLSVGGVRASLWDWRSSPADTAMGLLCVLEFERSVRAIAARGRAGP